MNLRIPGPTPVPDGILEAMSRPMINHRGPVFAKILGEVTASLKRFFRTSGDVLTITSSGTGGLEAAVVNVLSPGDKVLALSVGFFGDRFSEIAQLYGADVTRIEFEAGHGADPERVRQHLKQHPDTRAVLVTHNESSTGVTNPLPQIARVVRETDALLVVDAVSSIVGIDVRTDEWGLDVVATASQKAWAAPPGLAMVSMSERAWAANKVARMPRYYFDLAAAKSWLDRGQTLATPAVSVFFALHEALKLLEAEGLDNAIARHSRVAQRMRAGATELGLELFAEPSVASNTVTAIKAPAGISGNDVVRVLRDEHDIELAGGQGSFAGKIFRVGHLGWVDEADMDLVVEALRVALPKLGFRVGAPAR
jgi:aspartate aminotransferase-like enzyme